VQGRGEAEAVCIGCSLECEGIECRAIITDIGVDYWTLAGVLEKVYAIWRNKKITVLDGTTP